MMPTLYRATTSPCPAGCGERVTHDVEADPKPCSHACEFRRAMMDAIDAHDIWLTVDEMLSIVYEVLSIEPEQSDDRSPVELYNELVESLKPEAAPDDEELKGKYEEIHLAINEGWAHSALDELMYSHNWLAKQNKALTEASKKLGVKPMNMNIGERIAGGRAHSMLRKLQELSALFGGIDLWNTPALIPDALLILPGERAWKV